MKILIFSDIHANYEALKSLVQRETYDFSIFLGDSVDYGPQPAETLDLLLETTDIRIMGNHDRAVAYDEDCHCSLEMHDLSEYTRKEVSMKLLSSNDMDKLRKFDEFVTRDIENMKFYMTHASPNNHLYGYLFSTEAEMVCRDKKLSEFNYILVGHTHFMMIYRNRILNPGSSGQPRDGNPMPTYLLMDTENSQISFKRFSYDREKTREKLRDMIKDQAYLQRLLSFY